MSADAGLNWEIVYSFADKKKQKQEEEEAGDAEDIYVDVVEASELNNIAVAEGREPGTVAVAVVRPRNYYYNTNYVEVTRAQNTTQGAAEATWTSATTGNIDNWIDDRLFGSATTTSPVWESTTRVFVSSVAFPSPELSSPRPRIAFADVTDEGIGPFTPCAGVGLPDTPVPCILVEPDYIFAATWNGVYASTDGCATFLQLGSGLPNMQVRDLHLLPADGEQPRILRAGTYGRGVWELRLP